MKLYEIIYTCNPITYRYAFETAAERDAYASQCHCPKSYFESEYVKHGEGFFFNRLSGAREKNWLDIDALSSGIVNYYVDDAGSLTLVDSQHREYSLGIPDYFEEDHEYYNSTDHYIMSAYLVGFYSFSIEEMLSDTD